MARASAPATPHPQGEEKTAAVRSMFDTIAPRYEFMNRVLTFGLDRAWRNRAIRSLALPAGSVVLDLACGTGDLTRLATAAGYQVVGADLSLGMLEASTKPLVGTEADAAHLPFGDASMDGLLCGYALRNFTDLDASISEMARVVRPGGRLSVLEVSAPSSKLLGLGHRMWFTKAVPLIGGLLSDRAAYQYLPRSTAYLPGPEELRRRFSAAGFSAVNITQLSGGISQLIVATRAGRT